MHSCAANLDRSLCQQASFLTLMLCCILAAPPPPPAHRKAPLTPEVQSWAEEVALDEQGHVRMVRQVRWPLGGLCRWLFPAHCCAMNATELLGVQSLVLKNKDDR